MSKEEIITKVNGFLVDEFEIDAALLNDNAALKKLSLIHISEPTRRS